MSDKKDYYEILGISKGASKDEIHKAYLKKTKVYHPDLQAGKSDAEKKEAEEKMKLVNEANEVLMDDNKRQYYDQFGTIDPNAGRQGGFGGEDIFAHMRHHFRNMGGMGGMGGFGFGEQEPQGPDFTSPQTGRNIRITVEFSFLDAFYGTKKEFDINFDEVCESCHGNGAKADGMSQCPDCGGKGMRFVRNGFMMQGSTCPRCRGTGMQINKKCPDCGGQGHKKVHHHINVNIPRGVITGDTLRVRGEGEHGLCGGQAGDLFINCSITEHELFQREENDLITKTYISPIVASLGGKVIVKSLWGDVELTIPKGTKSGKIFKIPNKGMMRSGVCGDLHVVTEIEPYTNLKKKQIEELEKLAKLIEDDNLPMSNSLKQKYSQFEKELEERVKNDNNK